MVYDKSLDLSVPVYWVLMTGKTQCCYDTVFSAIIANVGNIDVATIGVNFERAFFTSVKKNFLVAELIEWFHLKQDFFCKLVQIKFPSWKIGIAFSSGMLDFLVLLYKCKLFARGIPFIWTRLMSTIVKYIEG